VSITITRPAADEATPEFQRYIAEIPDQNIGERLLDQLREIEHLFETVTDHDALARYAEGKWSIKEVLGHLIDSERIFSYRLLRIARGDTTPLPGFEGDDYVPAGRFDDRPLPLLLTEFRAVRMSTIALVDGVPADAWERWGEASGSAVTARALAYVIAGHVVHHVGVLRDRYGLSALVSSQSPA
jgi:DinB superfamily